MLSSAVLFVCVGFFLLCVDVDVFWGGCIFFFKVFLHECHQSVKLIRLISQQVKF